MTFWEFLSTPAARLVLAGAVLAILGLIAWWFIKGMRQDLQDEGPSANELLDQFRGLRDQGQLSPEEFKKIKSRLGGELREKLARDSQPGEKNGAPRGDAKPETKNSHEAIARALAASIEKARATETDRSDPT